MSYVSIAFTEYVLIKNTVIMYHTEQVIIKKNL